MANVNLVSCNLVAVMGQRADSSSEDDVKLVNTLLSIACLSNELYQLNRLKAHITELQVLLVHDCKHKPTLY